MVPSVSRALDSKLTNVKFPTSPYDIVRTKNNFFKIAKFPGVIGAIDGTLIPILAPKEDEHAYICRKGYHALNVQGVVDANHRLINIFLTKNKFRFIERNITIIFLCTRLNKAYIALIF